jgi:hypothetical protein
LDASTLGDACVGRETVTGINGRLPQRSGDAEGWNADFGASESAVLAEIEADSLFR